MSTRLEVNLTEDQLNELKRSRFYLFFYFWRGVDRENPVESPFVLIAIKF